LRAALSQMLCRLTLYARNDNCSNDIFIALAISPIVSISPKHQPDWMQRKVLCLSRCEVLPIISP
jgi:hypothetical protein